MLNAQKLGVLKSVKSKMIAGAHKRLRHPKRATRKDSDVAQNNI